VAAVRAAWRDLSADLARLGVLQVVDRHAVELAAHHLARRRRLAVYLAANGETYTTTTAQGCEMQRARPEVAMLGASDAFLAKFFQECGLTPTGRAKLGVPAETPRSASWFPPELRGEVDNYGNPVKPGDFA
jgi:P27 family predicted phage terminase small subunit